MNTHESTQNLSQRLEDVLRIWAHAQSPETDFGPWRMAAFKQPARLPSGQFFHPGELVLCRPAHEQADLAPRVGVPFAVWSFATHDEVLVPRGLMALQTEPFGEAQIAPAVAHPVAEQPANAAA